MIFDFIDEMHRELVMLRRSVIYDESMDTLNSTYRKNSSRNGDSSVYNIEEEKFRGSSNVFQTPSCKTSTKNSTSILAQRISSHRIKCSPGKSGRHSASPSLRK